MSEANNVVEAANLSKAYHNKTVLNNLPLSVKRGTVSVLGITQLKNDAIYFRKLAFSFRRTAGFHLQVLFIP